MHTGWCGGREVVDKGEKIVVGLLFTVLLLMLMTVNLESERNVRQCKAALEAKADTLIIAKVCR